MIDYLYDLLFISDAGIIIGGILIYLAIAAFVWLFLSRYGTVTMGPDPVLPTPDAPTLVIHTLPARPNWTPLADWYPWEEPGVIDLTDTVVIHPVVDPLADTAELERVDPGTPLFYSIKRPAPLELESYTEGITRAQIERAKAAKELAT